MEAKRQPLYETKRERQEAILTYIQTDPGIRNSEMAHRLGVERSTVTRDMRELVTQFNLQQDEAQGWFIEGDGFLKHIRFTLPEAIYIYLSCRLFANHIDKNSPLAARGIRKISSAVRPLSAEIANRMVDDAERLDNRPRSQASLQFQNTLKTLTQSWIERKKVHIQYPSSRTKALKKHTIGALRLLPNAAGSTFLVLAWEEGKAEPRTYRIDRILSAKLLDETFLCTWKYSPDDWLQYAWAIWGSADKPAEIAFRFSPQAAPRVRETQWHPTQTIQDQPDGSLILRLHIAEPIEMYPWIRGWGSDITVLTPASLREWHQKEIRKMTALYP